MAPQKQMYLKDEVVLCFHHEILYEAKILDVRLEDPKDKNSLHEYRVHYKGWKNTYVDPSATSCMFVQYSSYKKTNYIIQKIPQIQDATYVLSMRLTVIL